MKERQEEMLVSGFAMVFFGLLIPVLLWLNGVETNRTDATIPGGLLPIVFFCGISFFICFLFLMNSTRKCLMKKSM